MPQRSHNSHRLAFVGAGYVGLVSGTCLAEIGHRVILVDRNEHRIETLKAGGVPIFEPGLEELVKKNVAAGRLSFTMRLADAVRDSDVVFVAVNTPPDDSGAADLSFVRAAATEIARAADRDLIVVNKSTVPVGTGDLVAGILKTHGRARFDVVSNPEFLREGSAIQDFLKGDRIVVGASNERSANVLREIYEPLGQTILQTDVKSAELIKYASNAFLATKISFINAVARICELTGADVDDVADGMGLDKRIGRAFLNAGAGYGGSCFPKDVSACIAIAKQHGYPFDLLKEVESINEAARGLFVDKILRALGTAEGKRVGLWGLAFKPQTDDMRSAPAIAVSHRLHECGVRIRAYDPVALESGRAAIGDIIEYAPDMYDALSGADALVIITEWDQFKKPDWDKVRGLLKNPVIVDGRNLFKPADMAKLGFTYHSVGRISNPSGPATDDLVRDR